MRISSKSIYEAGIVQMNSLQSSLAKTQQQMSTNRRVLTPSDDPIASARALEVTQSQSINTQLVKNRQNATNFLSQETNALQDTRLLVQDVQALVVHAGDGSLRDNDRAALAIELEGRLNDLMAIGNTSDGAGGYLFSGFKSTTQPFSPTATGANYVGDSGQRQLQVGPSRFLPISDAGSTVFENNLNGNGTFVTGAAAQNFTNGGQGIISGGSVSDPSLLTKDDYTITLSVQPSATVPGEFDSTFVVTTASGNPTVPDMSTPQPYVSGQTIGFDGLQFDITGKPKDGDVFSVKPSTKESLFTTLKTLIGVLRSPGDGPAGQASLNNGLNAAHRTLDTAYDNVLSLEADVGSRMLELDYLESSGADLNLQYQSTLSDLQDLDFIAAASLYSQQQTTLQAAQKSFNSLAGLSLFNYIN